MRGVALDRLTEFLPDRPGVGLGRIGRAHHLTPVRDGVLALENHDVDRAGRHVRDERIEEALPRVLGVEALGFGLRDAVALERDDAEPFRLDARQDLPRVIRLDGVRLQDGERFFEQLPTLSERT